MKTVRELLGVPYDFSVAGITDDSRMVDKDFIFVATKGFHVDHFDYIQDAISKGACFLVLDREINISFPHVIVDHIEDTYKDLCKKFYDVKLSSFHFIGITGTDGKTTTASIVKELIQDCAYIGTNGLTINDSTISTNNTTPCVSELYQDLHLIQKSGLTNVSMEVSSEALLHDRVSNFLFDIICFTNITGDHLNVHGSFDNYVQCKLKLLDLVKKNGVVIANGDDPILRNIDCKNVAFFGFDSTNDYVISHVNYGVKYADITVIHDQKKYLLKSPLKGKYNVYNVVEAFLVGLFFGVEEGLLLERIQKIGPIKGRCEFLDFGQDFDIVLDYAHTINGIKTILDTFQDYEQIITVTGAAGGREKEKRPIIGKCVIDKSDVAIFTMDDPRFENVDDIINQMVGNEKDYIRIQNREEAICYALSIASKGSVVLILGKGRDNYMAIEDNKIPYSDYDTICHYFNVKDHK